MNAFARTSPALIAATLLGACAIIPAPDSTPPQPAGYAVPFDQPVQVGGLVVTPKKLVEDSRCAVGTQCVWAGRVVVTTRIAGAGWADTADLTLGESYGTHGRLVTLTGVFPEKTQAEVGSRAYRFTYEPR